MKKTVCLIPIVALLQGCSILFVQAPSAARDPERSPTCTTSLAVPVLDVLLASGALVGAAAATFEEPSSSYIRLGEEFLPLSMFALAGHATAAAYGFFQTSECRDQVDEWRAHQEPRARDEPITAPFLPRHPAP